jgi:hypothetical protein
MVGDSSRSLPLRAGLRVAAGTVTAVKSCI